MMILRLAPDITQEQRLHIDAWLRDRGTVPRVLRETDPQVWVLEPAPERCRPEEIRRLPGVDSVEGKDTALLAGRVDPSPAPLFIGGREVGGRDLLLAAGPCAVEGDEQADRCAEAVRSSGGTVLRGGAFKPRTSPYSFQGLGREGLMIQRRAADRHGLLVLSEVLDRQDIPLVAEYADILQVGTRNMQNFPLLRSLGKQERPVLLKRGFAATRDELLLAAEYILIGGNDRVILCERGVRCFDPTLRYTLDLASVCILKETTHLPILVDPSHATGRRDLVAPMARAAVAAGADGLLVEIHPSPETALSDGPQALAPEELRPLAQTISALAEVVGRSLEVPP